MDRVRKLLWMIFIFWVVFFIICDEKWYKIQWQNNHVVLEKIENKPDFLIAEDNTKIWDDIKKDMIRKNSDLIQINYEFQNPKTLRYAEGIDKKRLAQIKEEKRIEERIAKKQEKKSTEPIEIALNTETDTSSISEWLERQVKTENKTEREENIDYRNVTENIIEEEKEETVYYPVDKYYHNEHSLNLKMWEESEDNYKNEENRKNTEFEAHQEINNNSQRVSSNDIVEEIIDTIDSWELFEIEDKTLYKVEKYTHTPHILNIKKAEKTSSMDDNILSDEYTSIDEQKIINYSTRVNEIKKSDNLIKIEKYELKKHPLTLKKWLPITHKFEVEEMESSENWLSDSMIENLLKNEEIDINTLESENDEFLQKIFEKTKDIDVMNLIVETYLNEYQFVKAKKFIENLPESYSNKLKPSLNLRVAFNSFPLSSKTNTESLSALIKIYSSKNEIPVEDQNRYLWILALMDQNYDKFFEISKWFTSAKNKAFAVKLQWYKDQISKQMWMPEYYFDTLVSLELFNQWLFQPAKVLALYSLQQNSNYILPYQVLAYSNFLTNSWDTSIEYLKKLVDLDSNNAEKYRFLMWVASYRNEKYEQSVVMLSLVKDNNLRLDAQRYLINNYLQLNQSNKLISSWNKLLWYKNLVASDFYTYFYEVFFHPYSEWSEYKLFALDTELANKMLRVCTMTLPKDDRWVCTYWTIGRNIALWQFDGIEQYLLNLVSEYPQWYLYQALGDYYIQQGDLDKAKTYLLKAVSLTQKRKEINQIKKLLQNTM